MNTWDSNRPNAYRFWSRDAQHIYDERVAIMRESNRISDDKETPLTIIEIAKQQAKDFEDQRMAAGIPK